MSASRNIRAVPPSYLAAAVLALAAIVLTLGGHGLVVLAIVTLIGLILGSIRVAARHRALTSQIVALQALAGAGADVDEDPDAPLRRFLLAVKELTGFEHGVVWMESEAGSGLRPRAALGGAEPPGGPAAAGPDALVLQALGRTAPFRISRVDAAVADVDASRAESWMLCPLRLRGRAIGVAQLASPSSKPFTRNHPRLVEPLAGMAAVAFEAACIRRLMYRYADLAEVDSLTGIANRRRISNVLNREVERSARYGHPLALMILDVDGFKAFNDRYGHPQGDRLLQAMARVLRTGVRRIDHVARYGGEEFVVVLPETGRDAAYALAERLRTAVESEGFDTGIGTAVRKTVSIGVSAYPEDADTSEGLIERADDALYRAKRAGKNRVLAG